MSFIRARSDQQIKERIDTIVIETEKIYDALGYDAVSFTAISDHTSFTRPTIYKYFNNKEEIFLKILIKDLEKWIGTLYGNFKLNRLYTIEEISDIWVDSLLSNERLLKLYAILFTTLEINASKEALAEFKYESTMHHKKLFSLVKQLFPEVEDALISDFLLAQLTSALGVFPMCHLSDVQMEAIALSGTDYKPPNFKISYNKIVYKLLYCLKNGVSL